MRRVVQAIAYVKAHEKPLALYVFSNNKAVVDKVLTSTSSGGCVFGLVVCVCVCVRVGICVQFA